MISSIAVSVDTDGTSPGLDMRYLRLRSVAPRCVKHSTLGTFMLAASANACESASNIRGSDNAPLNTSSRPSRKTLPASSTQKTGFWAERVLSVSNQYGTLAAVHIEILTVCHQ